MYVQYIFQESLDEYNKSCWITGPSRSWGRHLQLAHKDATMNASHVLQLCLLRPQQRPKAANVGPPDAAAAACSLMNRCNEDDCWGSFTALLIQSAKEGRLVVLKALIGQCTILSIREEYKIEGAIACSWWTRHTTCVELCARCSPDMTHQKVVVRTVATCL